MQLVIEKLDIRCYFLHEYVKDVNHYINIVEGPFTNNLLKIEENVFLPKWVYIQLIPSKEKEREVFGKETVVIERYFDFSFFYANNNGIFRKTLILKFIKDIFIELCEKNLIIVKHCNSIEAAFQNTIKSSFLWTGNLKNEFISKLNKQFTIDYYFDEASQKITITGNLIDEDGNSIVKEIFNIHPSISELEEILNSRIQYKSNKIEMKFKDTKSKVLIYPENLKAEFIGRKNLLIYPID